MRCGGPAFVGAPVIERGIASDYRLSLLSRGNFTSGNRPMQRRLFSVLREYSALNPDGFSARVAQTQSAAGVEQCPTPASYHQSCLLPSISVCRATLDCATAFAPVVSLGSSLIRSFRCSLQ
jgi:hypothetical protein